MSLANQMIENMEESNFDTEKFAKMNDLLFSRMTKNNALTLKVGKKLSAIVLKANFGPKSFWHHF
ncbi:MAG: hypothetical protein Ct9H300mP17_04150 [Candidatus Nitrosopelagicus sp.]|nr:MAG: hypothetical protein Ct9H300mP17_04150 [Candidatus Nitrosopelagicus sp.]